MTSAELPITGHIDELRRRGIRTLIVLTIITIICLSFGLKSFTVVFSLPRAISLPNFTSDSRSSDSSVALRFYYPYPNPFENIAVQLTLLLKNTLLPPEVKFIQTAPGQAFFAQIHISLLLSIICSIPIIAREVFAFIYPALSTKTTTAIYKITLPILLLFIMGIVFSYLLVIPFTLSFLYKYGESLGAETFVTVSDFMTFVLQFMLGFGLAFQLPVIMYGLSLTGLVDSTFWSKNLRYAIVILAIFGALITPDGSGITMWFVSIPMIVLYLLGIVIIRRAERHRIVVSMR
jgi:sec-independent protein translocase protein TatC|uniref:Sec-independent protein translocase protein TatC n=1 Tax=uncultured crenarchaeote TaxID=29281 RepID=Q702E5_9CREN|nr:putative TatC protein secretion pathway component [uncultured crenarchaeote]